MRRNSDGIATKQLQDHHAFIVSTDRKSLHTQIKSLVQQAHEVALKELNERRDALQKLLDYEDKIYEEEFANQVKSRIDEDIKERKDILLKIKVESTRNEQEFLKAKRIQQYMNSCYEIRESLRHKEMQEVKQCQLEQILEKERSHRAMREQDRYWYNVQQKNLQMIDKSQQEEECLKRALVQHTNNALKVQMEEAQEKRQKAQQEKLEDKQKLDCLLEDLRLEKFDRQIKGKSPNAVEYRQELFKIMEEKNERSDKEQRERDLEQRQIIDESMRLEAEASAATAAKRKALQKATLEYLQYLQRMREIEDQQQRMYDDRVQDLRRVDLCTKGNILRERQRKALVAEQCYAELRKQICEQQERRLRDEAEQRECKILENRFVRDETSREQILQQRRKNREDLDKQVDELKRIRQAEESKFHTDITRACNDPDFCALLAERYIREGIDYLEPHANWRIVACSNKEFIPKPPALSKDVSKGKKSGLCFEPCVCVAKGKSEYLPVDGRGEM